MQVSEYKVSLVGKKNIGKTCFLKRLNNTFSEESNYIPTLGVSVSPIDILGNNGKIRLNVWDIAGDERFRGLKSDYHINSNLAVIFKNDDNEHLLFENELPNNIKKIYINNYNCINPELTIDQYKLLLYENILN